MARHVAKFHGVTPPNLKVIGANTLNSKPILYFPLKNCKGNPHPLWSVGEQDLAILWRV